MVGLTIAFMMTCLAMIGILIVRSVRNGNQSDQAAIEDGGLGVCAGCAARVAFDRWPGAFSSQPGRRCWRHHGRNPGWL